MKEASEGSGISLDVLEPPLTSLLKELSALAKLPLEAARTMPPRVYHDPDFTQLERDRIFHASWICFGREDQIPSAGGYLAHEIDGQPILVVRQKDGRLKAFANVCLHRGGVLATGQSRSGGPIVCPYHAWSYDHQGRLRATPLAPLQEDPHCKAGNLRLRSFRLETWGGFIFVSLKDDVSALSPQLTGLLEKLPNVNLEAYENVSLHDEVWAANWKLVVENFNESYHTFMVHKDSLQPLSPSQNAVMVAGEEAYGIHFSPLIEDADRELAHPNKPGVAREARNFLFVFTVWPSFMIAGTHNTLWWMSLQPAGPDKVAVRWGASLTPELLADESYGGYAEEFDGFVIAANAEDKLSLELVMRGVAAPFTQPGHLTPLDRVVWEFGQYIDRRVNGAKGAPVGHGAPMVLAN